MQRAFVCKHAMLDQVKAAWEKHAKGAATSGFHTILSDMDDFTEAMGAALDAVRATIAESRIVSTMIVTKNPRQRLLEISNEYTGQHGRSVFSDIGDPVTQWLEENGLIKKDGAGNWEIADEDAKPKKEKKEQKHKKDDKKKSKKESKKKKASSSGEDVSEDKNDKQAKKKARK